MSKVSAIHLPLQERVRQLRGIVAKQQFTIDEIIGKNQLMNEVVNLCALMAYKNGGEVTITKEDFDAVNGAKVKRHKDQETLSMTYSIELKKEGAPEAPKEKKPSLELVH